MLLSIILCVLALVVSLGGVVGLLIYVRSVRSSMEVQLFASSSATRDTSATWLQRHEERLSALAERVTACESGLKRTSGSELAAQVAVLDGAVEALAASQRKQFGKVWAELHQEGVLKRAAESQADVETPDEIRARLRAQHALPRIGAVVNGNEGD